ncbi:aspartate kinase [Clostridium sp. CX1]|uniref:Aspartokinase n=1 Tax=Clostridium tanneri TaxID=3037988 RepID=A0ABU4JSB4_9CLOT|nr:MULTISPECIES: aspartate kinase [unclassified Clostridium]MCT8976807.1 aspartate kinase [Clostridium sp. CX1]MDW8801012.1 aspartate kinase [Clostridium sp. A1-XYC3]
MKILIQKFGGTSVSTHERRALVVNKILKGIEEGFCPVVVVSAMGRKGQPYATDTLLSLISDEFKKKNSLGVDLLMGCGEIISTVVVSDELAKNNLQAVPLTGGQAGIITDDSYNNAAILRVESEKLLNILKEGKIPVVAGFQGVSEKGFITTIGRGGSDTTAALLGVALQAEEVQIYTDVDGIMTADPRIVSDASLIEEISYNEVFQFADQGAKVIHPRAVEIAMKGNIPLAIKNTMSDCKGTIISNKAIQSSNNVIDGITSMDKRVQVTVECSKNTDNDNYWVLFDELANKSISLDLINVFTKQKIFTIDEKDLDNLKIIMKNLGLQYSYVEECTKISLIGAGMRGIPGVMAKILKILARERIDVLQTADSHTTIWCLVESKNAERAINSLHRDFKLGGCEG